MLPLILIAGGAGLVLAMLVLAFSGTVGLPRADAADRGAARAAWAGGRRRRCADSRHSPPRATRGWTWRSGGCCPNRALLAKRLAMTGKDWTVGQYGLATAGLGVLTLLLLLMKGAPLLLTLFATMVVGGGVPHFVVGRVISRRVAKFTLRFPDAIDLLVRGCARACRSARRWAWSGPRSRDRWARSSAPCPTR